MGKQGHGIGKGKPKMRDRGFGSALIKQQQSGGKALNGLFYYGDAEKKTTLMSNLESSDLNEYMDGIELEDKDIEVRRVKSDADAAFLVEGTTHHNVVQSLTTAQFDYSHLPVPRKPQWNTNMNAGEVDTNERQAFLQWRRTIAQMEEANAGAYKVTPFEKNLEVWRQLWRVLEKSDIGVQIVDARNPLLYYTEDLLQYAGECNCPTILILNKADFLTEYQRKAWAQYFDSIGVQFAFYSAANEQHKVDTVARLSTKIGLDSDEMKELAALRIAIESCDSDLVEAMAEDIVIRWRTKQEEITTATGATATATASSSSASAGAVSNANTNSVKVQPTPSPVAATKLTPEEQLDALETAELLQRRCRVLTRLELIFLLERIPNILNIKGQKRHQGRVCVGLMGFPNVGKSSAINSILAVSKISHGVTRVAVSSTPGKTKHFQTLIVNDNLMLCDCPGLVFPSFMRSIGEMLCAGILPINQMRTYLEPAAVISSRVPQHLIEATYGIKIRRDLDIKDNPNRPPTGSEMLCAYCQVKGYIATGSGRWDEFKAAKEIIRDFCDGILLFVAPPDMGEITAGKNPGIDYRRWLKDTEIIMQKSEKVNDRLVELHLKEIEERQEDMKIAQHIAQREAVLKGADMVFGGGKWDTSAVSSLKVGGGGGGGSAGSGAAITVTQIEGDSEGGEELHSAFTTVPSVFAAAASASASAAKDNILVSTFGPIYDDESSDDEDSDLISTSTITSKIGGDKATSTDVELSKREHKKVKHWGKKNKKLRDKNPYGEENGKVALTIHSTLRARSGYSTTRAVPLK